LVINTDHSRLDVVEPKQQSDDGTLAGARRTNQSIRVTRWNKEWDPFQDRLTAHITASSADTWRLFIM